VKRNHYYVHLSRSFETINDDARRQQAAASFKIATIWRRPDIAADLPALE
jgi:hypothetical protein